MDRGQRQRALDLYHRVTRDPDYLRLDNMEAAQIVAFLGDALIHIETQERQVERLQEVVKTYADRENWYDDSVEGDVWYIAGERGWEPARRALEGERE